MAVAYSGHFACNGHPFYKIVAKAKIVICSNNSQVRKALTAALSAHALYLGPYPGTMPPLRLLTVESTARLKQGTFYPVFTFHLWQAEIGCFVLLQKAVTLAP